MGLGGALAAWSGGQAIFVPAVGIFGATMVLLGTIVSYLIRSALGGSKWLRIDALFYTAGAIAAVIFNVQLQSIMPEGGYPKELFAAGFLTWMLIFGSVVSWRDTTLLFQAVPAIAMFGLIGCYDTYRGVVFPFYAFLLCLATFFARAHGRQMLQQAASSGYFTRGRAPGTPEPVVEVTPGLTEEMRQGPWRWVAGPEWALASAFVIVLFSLLGTPVIQSSVQGVAGFVSVTAPSLTLPSTIPPVVGTSSTGQVHIGQGPAHLTEKPVLAADIRQPYYLRNAIYDQYADRGWYRSNGLPARSDPLEPLLNLIDTDSVRTIDYQIYLLQPVQPIPAPAEPIASAESVYNASSSSRVPGAIKVAKGQSVLANDPDRAKDIPSPVPQDFEIYQKVDGIPPRVAALAKEVTKHAKTDYEKAMAIEAEIDRRIKYNINAEATPEGQDPVEYALFDQHEAYCDVFASSVVLMSRAVGIPARYCTGFLPDTNMRLSDGTIMVRENDAHAWAELLFNHTGWLIVDATSGAQEVEGGGVGESTKETPWYQTPVVAGIVDGAILLTLVGGLGFYAWSVRHRKLHPNYLGELDRAYLSFASLLKKVSGVRRQAGMTASDYMIAVSPHLGSHAEEARDLSRQFETAYYSAAVLGAETVSDLHERVESLRRALSKRDK